ncbi:MAG: UPF0182 family protein [Pyrinomonadaceae bacterium]
MSEQDYSDLDDEIIDITPRDPQPLGRLFRFKWLFAALVLLLVAAWQAIYIYTDHLWYQSLGFSSRFWYVFGLKWGLFAAFGIVTFVVLRAGFYVLEKWFRASALAKRKMVVNKQVVEIDPSAYLRPAAWALAAFLAYFQAMELSQDWQSWVVYFHQPVTAAADPIFGQSVGFYLFSLPVLEIVLGSLTWITVVLLFAAGFFSFLSAVPTQTRPGQKPAINDGALKLVYPAISILLGVLLLIVAARTVLSRYGYLWTDHASFSGVTYTEANYTLPGLMIVAVALAIGAVVLFVNAFTRRSGRLVIVALAIPFAAFMIARVAIPAYVQSFIVKPNELDRETPYIEHNIAGTRAGFKIDHVKTLDYAADISPAAFDLETNRATLSNIRLWDWNALQDTLRQIQEIRTYYDFPDVDVDRYKINGEMRQVMVATREFDINKLPAQSRNWINERLVYTHGYGLTMNPVNEFTTEGRPKFILSNMPVESTADIKITRPEIYFGERTDTTVYVKTKQREFDYPQGDKNNYTSYEGEGGFAVGSGLRRLLIAWATDDLSKLPFSEDVTAESRVLMHRNIVERIKRVAPFFDYDDDPYMVINDDGRLVWMIDGYTTADTYPYSRHFNANGRRVNYIRNSVKVTVDAYNGTVIFYVFDEADPVVNAYRAAFPELFKNANEMPSGLKPHIRYPEGMIKVQGDVFGLYHTESPKMFFGREDVWSVAREAGTASSDGKSQSEPGALEPYQVLMPLPGENLGPEFAQILPFTPGNRNNMIAWMAGRSDGDVFGQLLVYNFPSSRVIDGPLQIEARIDQDAQIAAQITLWNQQGSTVKRGNLIIMPIGTGLLFVEPIYLQAVRSPMPELRLVVLATQERLTYASDFETALTQLMGLKPTETDKPPPSAEGEPTPQAPSPANDLIRRAGQTFADYQRLTSEGKLGEAGKKLDELKQILEQLQGQQK